MLGLRVALNLEIEINNEPLAIYGARERVFMVKRRGESMRHVMMKLLSYLLFYHERLEIEASASQHYKPDLVRFDLRGEPVQWVDCGQTSLAKLDKISRKNRQTYIDIMKASPGELAAYKLQADTRLNKPERVRYWSASERLIERLGEVLGGRHTIHATITPGYEHIYILVDSEVSLDAPIVWMGTAESPERERAREREELARSELTGVSFMTE